MPAFANQKELKEYRELVDFLKKKGFNQTNIAEKLGVNKSTISGYYVKEGESDPELNPKKVRDYIGKMKTEFPAEAEEFETINAEDQQETYKTMTEAEFRSALLGKLGELTDSIGELKIKIDKTLEVNTQVEKAKKIEDEEMTGDGVTTGDGVKTEERAKTGDGVKTKDQANTEEVEKTDNRR